MKPFFLIILWLLLVMACTTTPQDVVNHSGETKSLDKAKETLRLKYLKEVEWPKAYAEQDTVLLDKILGDDFQMIDQSGAWTDKKFEINWIKKNKTSHDSFKYEIKRLDILDNGTAVVCGEGQMTNAGKHATYQSSNILVLRNGEWKAISSHVSGYKELN